MRRLSPALMALVCAAAGCDDRSAGPKTYPVKGRTSFQEDGQPMTAGMVQFESTTDANLNGRGDLGADGTFTLSTIVGDKKVGGLAAGTYRAWVLPPQGADHAARPLVARGLFKVDPAGPNEFTLTLPGKAKRAR
jgi:hypothetical protein